jgi:hypothetical protein
VRTAVDIAGCFLLAAAVAALVRFFFGWTWRKLRVLGLWVYRCLILLAGASVAGGAVYMSAHGNSRNWNGIILFLILFGAISLAPIFAGVADGIWWLLQRLWHRFFARDRERGGIAPSG